MRFQTQKAIWVKNHLDYDLLHLTWIRSRNKLDCYKEGSEYRKLSALRNILLCLLQKARRPFMANRRFLFRNHPLHIETSRPSDQADLIRETAATSGVLPLTLTTQSRCQVWTLLCLANQPDLLSPTTLGCLLQAFSRLCCIELIRDVLPPWLEMEIGITMSYQLQGVPLSGTTNSHPRN